VNACDMYWNKVENTNPWVAIWTSDKYDIHPSSKQLVNGTTTFTLTLVTGNLSSGSTEYAVIYTSATTVSTPNLAQIISAGIPVKPSDANKLLVVMPGEKHEPGKYQIAPYGLLDKPNMLVAGSTITLSVLLVDNYYNIVSLNEPTLRVWTEDPNDIFSAPPAPPAEGTEKQLVNGKETFDIYMITANDTSVGISPYWRVYVRDIDGILPNYTPTDVVSSTVTVTPNTVDRLLLLVPNEVHQPGTVSGKSGSLQNRTAGEQFTITVKACDRYWNRTNDSRQVKVETPDDPYDTEPAQQPLVNGARDFLISLITCDPITGWKYHKIIAKDPSMGISSQTVYNLRLDPGNAIKLALVMPWEELDPGSSSGKKVVGPTTTIQAGSVFYARVYLCDSYWNKVLLDEPTVQIRIPDRTVKGLSDADESEPSAAQLVAGQKDFLMTLYCAATRYILVEDIDGVSPMYPSTSTIVTVTPRTASRYLALYEGDFYYPGKHQTPPYGKQDNALTYPKVAGQPFVVEVRAVDSYWNTSSTNTTVWIETYDDQYDIEPSPKNIVDVATFSATLVTRRDVSRIRVSDGAGSGLAEYEHNPPNFISRVKVIASNPARVVIVAPGESLAEGKFLDEPKGKTGSPNQQVSGQDFNLTLYLTDGYYNQITVNPPDVSGTISSNDPNDSSSPYGGYDPLDFNFSGGVGNVSWKFITSTGTFTQPGIGWTLTCSPVGYSSSTTTIKVSTNVAMGVKLLVLREGEIFAPGTINGKVGTAITPVAGSTYTITVKSCDYYWNQTNDVPVVSVKSYDPYDDTEYENNLWLNKPLTAGTRNFEAKHYKATSNAWLGTIYVGGSIYGLSYSSYTTSLFVIDPSSAVKLQVLIGPNEQSEPGKPPYYPPYSDGGKSGTVDTKVAGQPFWVYINGVDTYWNVVSGAAADVRLVSTDPYDSEPVGTLPLSNGSAQYLWTLISATSSGWTITASDEKVSGVKLSSYTSSLIKVNAATPTKLLTLVPNEYEVQGSSTGKAGNVEVQTAGISFPVRVYTVDNYNNIRTDVSGENVWIQTSDPWDVPPSTLTFISGTTTFMVTFVTATDEINRQNHPTPPGPSTGWRITAYSTNYSASTSSVISVQPNPSTAEDKIQLLLPNEVARPGKAPYDNYSGGRDSSTYTRTAGVQFAVTVNVCDKYWNRLTADVSNINLSCVGFEDYTSDGKTPKFVSLIGGTSSYYLTFYTTGSWSISATHSDYAPFNSSIINITPGTENKLLIVLPNQTIAPLSQTGRTGTPQNATAGQPYYVTVYACDQWYNYQSVEQASSTVRITATDPFYTQPSDLVLQNGTTIFALTLVTAGTCSVTVSDLTSPIMSSNISSTFTVVAGDARKLLVLLPGENILPGSSSGKQGTPTIQTAGKPFNVRVYATDNYFNPVNDNSIVKIQTSDLWDIHPSTQQLVNGTTIFSVVLVTAGNNEIYAIDTDSPYLETSTSSIVSVNPNIETLSDLKLQILLPGETPQSGKWENGVNPEPYGKDGSPTDRTAGNNFNVTVNLVDKYYNKVESGVSMPWVQLVKVGNYDPYAVYPSSAQLIDGTTTFVVQLRTSGWAIEPSSWTITVRDVDGVESNYTENTSPLVKVVPNIVKKLQIILPGETWVPGSVTGISGSPVAQVADSTFSITVQTCDDYWNVTNTNITASLTTEDPNDSNDPQSLGITQGRTIINRSLVTATTDGWRITVSAQGLVEYVTQKILVNAAPPTKLLCILPNETYLPGSATGKSGSIATQYAGVPFNITVLITDNRWNLVSSTSALIGITTEDPYDIHPSSASTTNGIVMFNIEFRRGVNESYRIFASTASGEPFQMYVTSPIPSSYGAATKLQLIVPGETAVPGKWDTHEK